MNRLLISLFACCILFSCGNKPAVPGASNPKADSATTARADSPSAYLPISDFLREDLRRIDSFATGILRKGAVNGKKDSAFVKLPELHKAAEQFFPSALDSTFFRQNFSETSFLDQTTEQLNFIYTALDSTSSLRQVVVYVKPNVSTNSIDRIYMEMASREGEAVVEKKLTWKMQKYFYVLTIKQPQSGTPVTTLQKLIWDPQHFGDE